MNRFGSQDGRIMGIRVLSRGIFLIILIYSCINLIGFPLSMGFLSKDYILEFIFSWEFEIYLVFMFYLSCMITICYSFKLYLLVCKCLKFGGVLLKLEFLNGGKFFLILMFVKLRCVGLFLEEFMFDSVILVADLNYKIMDFFLLFGSIFLLFFFEKFGLVKYDFLDYFCLIYIYNFILVILRNFYFFKSFIMDY